MLLLDAEVGRQRRRNVLTEVNELERAPRYASVRLQCELEWVTVGWPRHAGAKFGISVRSQPDGGSR